MKITILDDYQDAVKSLDCFGLLKGYDVDVLTHNYNSVEELASRLSDSDALVLIRERTDIDRRLLALLPKLKLISQTGKISQHIDLAACTQVKVAVAEGVGSPIAPSELCWALIMAASRHIPAYVSHLQAGQWQFSGSLGLGRTLHGLTLGIWGYGKIGKRIAQYAKVFGMNVLVWGSVESRLAAEQDGFSAALSKADFFRTSDVLSLHLRLNDLTSGCVTESDLKLMKPDALFVNISRAELIQSGALHQALLLGRPGVAALDVFDIEPLDPAFEPLSLLPNVLCTPHLGYVEKNSYELYFKYAFTNIIDFFEGTPKNITNPEVLF